MSKDPERLLLTGGEQEPVKAGAAHRYERARIVELDAHTGERLRGAEYISPQEVVAPDHPSVTFKAATVVEDRLYVCTTTEALVYDLKNLSLVHRLTHPWFNDLHHVTPTPEGHLLLAATGVDLVLECTLDGQIVAEYPVVPGEPWGRLDRAIDYRRVASTKPHAAHPNFVWRRGSEVWVNRLKQNDAICLNAARPALPLTAQCHDGVAFEGEWWFTTVDGRLHVFDAERLELKTRYDLNRFEGSSDVLGWCRSVLPLSRRRAWVGFSRLRPTKFAEHLSWVRHGGRMIYRPTRIVLYDLEAGRPLREVSIERFGIHAVFSILDPARAIPLA